GAARSDAGGRGGAAGQGEGGGIGARRRARRGRRRDRRRSMSETRASGVDAADRPTSAEDRLRRVLEGVIGVPATEGNRIDVLRNGDRIFPAMLDAIEHGRHTIDFLTFVYWEGQIGREFAHRLADRASSGVRVRVLLDAWGARTMEHSLIDLMLSTGVQVRWFRPLRRFWP